MKTLQEQANELTDIKKRLFDLYFESFDDDLYRIYKEVQLKAKETQAKVDNCLNDIIDGLEKL